MQTEHAPHERTPKATPRKPLQAAVQQLWDALYRSGELIVTLRDDNASLGDAVSRLEAETETRRQNYDELAVQLARLQDQNRDYETRLGGVKQREELQARIDEALRHKDERIAALEAETANLSAQNHTLADESGRRAEAIVHRDKMLERLEVAERENKSLRDELSELQQFRMNMEIMQKELARRNAELNSRLNEVQQFRNLVAELENKLFRIPKLEEELDAAAAMIAAQAAEITEFEKTHHQAAEYSRLYEIQQATLEAYSQKNLEYNVQLTARAKELDDARVQVRELEQRLGEERTATEKLHIELRSAREYEAQISQHLASLEHYSAQVVEVKKINHAQEDQIRELTDLLTQSEAMQKAEIAAKLEAQEIAAALGAKYEAALANIEAKESAGAEMEGTIAVLRLEAEQTAAALAAKIKEAAALQTALEAAETAKTGAMEAVAAGNSALAERTAELAAARNDLDALRKHLDETSNSGAATEQQLRGEISAKQEQLEAAGALIATLETDLAAAIANAETLSASAASAAKEHTEAAAGLLETITRKDEEISRITGDSDARAAEIERLSAEVAELQSAAAAREETYTIDVGALTAALEAKTQEVARLSKEIADAWKSTDDQRGIRETEREIYEGEKQSFVAEIREKEAEAKRLMERIAVLESDYAHEKEQNIRRAAALSDERDQLAAETAEKDLRIESLAASADAMRDELEQEFAARRAREARLREEAEQLRGKLDEGDEQFERLVKENAALRKEVDDSKTQAADLSTQLQSAQAEARRAAETAKERYDAVFGEKEQLAGMVALYREAQQDVMRLDERNVELEQEIGSLTSEFAKTRQALHQANQRLAELSANGQGAPPADGQGGDQRDKVLGKIGDILSRLEGALQQEEQ